MIMIIHLSWGMGGEFGNGTMSKMSLMVAYHEKYLRWA